MKLFIVLIAWWFLYFGGDLNDTPVAVIGPFKAQGQCEMMRNTFLLKRKQPEYWVSECYEA